MIEQRKKLTQFRCVAQLLLGVGSMCFLASANAGGTPWSVYAGAGNVQFDAAASVSANGTPVAGGNASASSSSGLAFGIVYAFDPDWSGELALGLPLTTTLSGAGTLQAASRLGEVEYGPAVLSLRRYLPTMGALKPYVGAGINYTMVLSNKDLTDLVC